MIHNGRVGDFLQGTFTTKAVYFLSSTGMILDGLEVKQRENETKKCAHANRTRYLKVPAEIEFFTPPTRLISHLECVDFRLMRD